MRVRLLVIAAVIVAVVAGLGVAIASGSDDSGSSAAPEPTIYCDAARQALQYPGSDAAGLLTLLDRVQALAPADVAPTVRLVRATLPDPARYAAAHNVWDYYNTSHCCDCHYATPPPEISAFTPEQRARVEAGGLP